MCVTMCVNKVTSNLFHFVSLLCFTQTHFICGLSPFTRNLLVYFHICGGRGDLLMLVGLTLIYIYIYILTDVFGEMALLFTLSSDDQTWVCKNFMRLPGLLFTNVTVCHSVFAGMYFDIILRRI